MRLLVYTFRLITIEMYTTRIHEIATIPDGKWQQSEGSQMVFCKELLGKDTENW